MPGRDGVPGEGARHDETTTVTEWLSYGVDGRLAADPAAGYARKTERRDQAGNILEIAYFDAAGRAVANQDGIAPRAADV